MWYVPDMRSSNLLFFEDDLDSQLRARQHRVRGALDSIPEQQFLISNDQELVDHIVAELTVEPLVLREEATTMKKTETQVDVSGDPRRVFRPGQGDPFNIPGTRIDVDIPFTGNEWLFQYRTNPWSSVFPRAEVNRGYLRISISLPHDAEPERFKETYERELKLIKEYVELSYNLPCEESGEWRIQMRSAEDEGRRVTVHLFVFDLYQDREPPVRGQ